MILLHWHGKTYDMHPDQVAAWAKERIDQGGEVWLRTVFGCELFNSPAQLFSAFTHEEILL